MARKPPKIGKLRPLAKGAVERTVRRLEKTRHERIGAELERQLNALEHGLADYLGGDPNLVGEQPASAERKPRARTPRPQGGAMATPGPDYDRQHGLELVCAQLLAFLENLPRIPTGSTVTVSMPAQQLDAWCHALHRVLGLRRAGKPLR